MGEDIKVGLDKRVERMGKRNNGRYGRKEVDAGLMASEDVRKTGEIKVVKW